MAILKNDIKIFQAQDNTDNDSGGGSRIATEIIDGNINNLFPDISRIDTVSGDVGMRKVFPTVFSVNRDIYFGAHAMISKTPDDPKVSMLLFHTDDPHDRRSDAQNKIESYLTASYLEQFYVFGNHVIGAKSVTWLQTLSSTQPVVGEVYYLVNPNGDEQYIRVVDINSQVIVLSHSNGNVITDYSRRRIICEIEQPLEFEFIGSDFDPVGQQAGTADTFATQISDAAKFYSTKVLAVDALQDDLIINVDSIFEQVVPAAKKQVPVVNQPALVFSDSLVGTGVTETTNYSGLNVIGAAIVLQDSFMPKTLFIGATHKDDGQGSVIEISTTNVVASIDYKTGTIIVTGSGMSSNIAVTYEIANVVESGIEFTQGVTVTTGNQGLVFVKNLSPLPSVTDLFVDYRSGGKWYTISSNADGSVGNDPTVGAGLLSDNGDNTGTLSLTLGALPDIDSVIIFSWGSAERLTFQDDVQLIQGDNNIMPEITTRYMEIDLPHREIDPASFSLTSEVSSTSQTLTCDIEGILIDSSAGGVQCKGFIDLIDGKIYVEENQSSTRWQDVGHASDVVIDYDHFDTSSASANFQLKNKVASKTPTGLEVTLTENAGLGTLSFSIGETINNRSAVRLSVPLYPFLTSPIVSFRDIKIIVNLGVLSDGSIYALGNSYDSVITNKITGTLATNGDVVINLIKTVTREENPAYAGAFGSTERYIETYDFFKIQDNDISVEYRTDKPDVSVPVANNVITDKIENLAVYKINTVGGIGGEVSFDFLELGSTNTDYKLFSKNGVVYNNITNTGIGTQVGTINYNTGEISISYFSNPTKIAVSFKSLFTDEIHILEEAVGVYVEPLDDVIFRTAATKLTSASFQLRYENENGNFIATTDGNGDITGTDISGTVDVKTGRVDVTFTTPAYANSLFYDAVAESSLPLDPELLGLNPVRLPADGRVPVFEAGRHVVIFNEVTTAVVGGTPVADQVDTLARSGQSYIEVIDVNGKRLDPNEYVADRVLGTVTFGNPLVLEDKYNNALTAPFSIVDRVEDMVLATEVQINGDMTLSAGLSRNYLKDVTYVASALVWGDTGSRTYGLFSEEIWNNGNPVWSDVRIGDPTAAQYDEINNPLEIDNANSTSGRWSIVFQSSTVVDVIEETLGVVQDNISITIDDVAPINPATGSPYFIMRKEGFGAGWVTNNFIRVNTDSGDNNMWVIRTVQSGALSDSTDDAELEIRGDAN